jgi:glutamine---fructose-6-phosphate transaminase (isomerizing)
MTEELIPTEIHAIPEAIQATVRDARPAAHAAGEAIRARQPRRVYFIGNGTSLYSSMAAVYTARLLAGPADPLVMAWPAGDFNYFTPQLNEQDVVVGISASGEFRDVLSVFERLEGKCLRVGVTHVPGSSIAALSDQLITSTGGPSHVPVMTKTYASTLTAEHVLLLELFQAADSYYDDLLRTADRVAAALREANIRVPALVEKLKSYSHAFYFGAGPAYPAALEGSLKMKEMALLHAEGNETWETASGAATLIGPEAFCVAMDAGGAGQSATQNLAEGVRQWGSTLLTVGPEEFAGGEHLPVTLPEVASFASLALVPPAALLAYRLARARGANPNQPGWRERYYSQGMTHILG